MDKPLYLDSSKTPYERAADLVSRMSLDEKISQTLYGASAIPRLGIPEYNWWNEALHGVARAGIATVFPQAIGMAATFDAPALYKTATAISDEARAKHHMNAKYGDRTIYKGLTFWSPNVNIFRDPRWGRGHETYGECPYLTGRMGVAFVKGLQGEDEKYLKTVATPKHYAVHSGPEPLRHEFNAVVSKKDLYETYLPAFKETVKEAGAYSIMGAYNRTNGEPCCGSKTLLEDILRGEWGFKGYVVSDCGAIDDFHKTHKVTKTPAESAALAMKNGMDLNCGRTYACLNEAVKTGLIKEEILDRSVIRLMEARIRLGLFEEEDCPYSKIPFDVVDCEEHRQLALDMSRASMVLLKNDGILPLTQEIKTVAVIGPNADDKMVLLGNYYGEPSQYSTVLDGIREKAGSGCKVYYNPGCDMTVPPEAGWGDTPYRYFAEAMYMAERSDVIILCLGLNPDMEGEEGSVANSDGGGDKQTVELPRIQNELLNALSTLNKPIITILINGSAVSANEVNEKSNAVLEAWYPGQDGGKAVADILFGDYNPAGRLPVTFVKSMEQLPAFTDYSMEGRTYRYMREEPLYPFGYGLSYTKFEYGKLCLSSSELRAGEPLTVKVDATNAGAFSGDEVTELYLTDCEASVPVPRWSLKGFCRTRLNAGETRTLEFMLTPRDMALINNEGKAILEPGRFTLYLGGHQPDALSERLTGGSVLQGEFIVTGEPLELEY